MGGAFGEGEFMIVAIWFGTVGIIFLVGMGLVVLTFRHWYLEAKIRGLSKGQKLEDDVISPTSSAP